MKILVVLAHPALHRSRINSSLAEVAREHPQTQVVDLYNTYPDFEIQVGQEQDRLRAADVIVLQHPFYWYSTPALLKEWVDLVFQHGFAYGEDSNELAGKILTQAISTGGDADAYTKDGFNGFSIEELLRPMQATAHFCDMRWQQPFLTQGGHIITDEGINAAKERYRQWLDGFVASEESA